jgi:hypothetical protein
MPWSSTRGACASGPLAGLRPALAPAANAYRRAGCNTQRFRTRLFAKQARALPGPTATRDTPWVPREELDRVGALGRHTGQCVGRHSPRRLAEDDQGFLTCRVAAPPVRGGSAGRAPPGTGLLLPCPLRLQAAPAANDKAVWSYYPVAAQRAACRRLAPARRRASALNTASHLRRLSGQRLVGFGCCDRRNSRASAVRPAWTTLYCIVTQVSSRS